MLEQLVRQYLSALKHAQIEEKLWIIEIGRIRIHQLEGGDL